MVDPVVLVRFEPHVTQQARHFRSFPKVWYIDCEESMVARFQKRFVAASRGADVFDLEQWPRLFRQTVAGAVDLVVVHVEAAHHDGGFARPVFDVPERIGVGEATIDVCATAFFHRRAVSLP